MSEDNNKNESCLTDAQSFGENEFYNWCEANGIDHDESTMDENSLDDFKKIKKRFITAVTEKRIVVNGRNIEYTVSKYSEEHAGQVYIISPPNGRAMLAMDGYKDNAQMQKFQAFIAAMVGFKKYDMNKISELDNRDLRFLQDIATLFLTA